MGTVRKSLKYHCSDDCVQSGCPNHTASMEYQSTADILHYDDGKGQDVYFERGSFRAFMTMLAECGWARVEVEHEIENCHKKLKEKS